MEFAHTTDEVQVKSKAPIYIYDRLGEPNKDMLEQNLAYAEGGDIAVTFASGMAAISGVLGMLTGSGSEIVAHKVLYGCTYSLLTNWYPRLKIGVKFVDFSNPAEVAAAITKNTRVLYMESPGESRRCGLLTCRRSRRSRARRTSGGHLEDRLYTVVDSTFASPFCQRPIAHGIDFVVHSLTKAIGGFGTDIGGVVVGPRWSHDMLMLYRKDFGGVLSSKAAWPVLVVGLPSLAVRMRQMQATAQKVAEFLETRPEIERVLYPGLTSLPAGGTGAAADGGLRRQLRSRFDGVFRDEGRPPQDESLKRAERFINHIAQSAYCITLAVSLGNIRTLIEHPGSMTHSAFPADEQVAKGLDPGGVRLALGLEKPEDIIRDLAASLDATS